MSDRIAVMSRGQRRADRHARRRSTTSRRASSSPASSARRTCSRRTLRARADGAPVAISRLGRRARRCVGRRGRATATRSRVMLRPGADLRRRRRRHRTVGGSGDGQGRDLPGFVAADDRRRARRDRAAREHRSRRRHAGAPARATSSRSGGRPGSAYLLRGRSEIVGATTTDVDEVQATMEGKDVSRPARPPIRPATRRGSTGGRC